MTIVAWVVAAVAAVVAVVAWTSGSKATSAASTYRRAVEALARDLKKGTALPGGDVAEDEPDPVRQVRHAVAEGWAPRREEASGDDDVALSRFAGYLRGSVADPLEKGLDADEAELREWALAALDAVEDTEFFLSEPDADFASANLGQVVDSVTKEFLKEFDTMVKVRLADTPVQARLATELFKDAVYLILANAGRFAPGSSIEVTVDEDAGRARVLIRDHGPGFSAEALERATEPFFTTDESLLGLGLAYVSRAVERHAGEVHLRNHDGGGAEVEVLIPKER